MKRALVLCLMICVSVIPVLPRGVDDVIPGQSRGDAQKLSTKEQKRQAAFREKVEALGPGAEIRVEMRGGSVTYQGTIDEISAENFKLKMKDEVLPIQYVQVETLNLKEHHYKTLGQPDPVRVRQVVADMGVGKKAKAKLVSNEGFSGTIQSFDNESFVVSSQSQPVKFSEVKDIEQKHLSLGARIGIVAAIAVGFLFALYAAAYGD